MRYWVQNEVTGHWAHFTDHNGKHARELMNKGFYVDHRRPVQTLTDAEIHQIMTNQSWEGIAP